MGTSIGANDGLPLLAFPFKLMRSWLPDDVQYFGLWLFISYSLQGVFGYLLVYTLTSKRWLSLLGSLLVLLSPIFIFRAGHIALASHWLLLAALWHYARSVRRGHVQPRFYAATWVLIIGIAGLVHVYLTAMATAFFVLSLIDEVGSKRRFLLKDALLLAAGVFTLLGLEWWLSGLFGLGKGGGFTLYTLHPAALFNPLGYSRFLPSLPVGPGQYEGFAYLGLGFLLLGAVALVSLIKHAPLRARTLARWGAPERRPLLILGLALILFSFGNKPLFRLEVFALYLLLAWLLLRYPPGFLQRWPMPLRLTALVVALLLLAFVMWAAIPQFISAFRSPGRFVWPVVYGLELLVITFVCRQFRPPLAAAFLVGALGLQLLDVKIDHRFVAGHTTFREHLTSDAWLEVTAPYSTLAVVPPFVRSLAARNDYLDFGYLAATTGKRVTTGAVARAPESYPVVTAALVREALSGPRDPDTLYIFSSERYEQRFKKEMRTGLNCTELDAYTLCSLRSLPENP